MTCVLPADGGTPVRAGVRAVPAGGGGTEAVAEAADGRGAVELTGAHRPDVALLGTRVPRGDGLAAAEETLRTVPGTAAAMLVTFSERAYVARTLLGRTGLQRLAAHVRHSRGHGCKARDRERPGAGAPSATSRRRTVRRTTAVRPPPRSRRCVVPTPGAVRGAGDVAVDPDVREARGHGP